MSEGTTAKKSDKIGGFDKWDITSAFRTLEDAREILADEKKVAAIRIYAKERLVATAEVAAQLDLEKTVKGKLTKVFKE